jgi:MFS family permease
MLAWLRQSSRIERRTFGACLAGWSLDALDVQLFSLVIPALIASWQVSKAEAGLIASVTLFASALGGWLGGALADRIGRVRALQVTILWFAIATFVSAFTQSFEQLMAVKALQGLGFGAEWAAGAVLMSETINPANRGKALGAVQSGWAIGWGAAVLLYTAVFLLFPSEVAWRVLFALGLLPALLVFYVRKRVPEPPRTAATVRTASFARSLVGIFARAATLRVSLVGILFGLGAHGGYYGLFTWLPTFLRTERHLSVIGTGTYLGVIIVAYWLGCVSAGQLLDRIGRRPTVILFAAGSVALTVIYLMAPITPAMMLVLGFPLGFCAAGIPASMATIFTELYPEEIRGTGVGFCYNAGRVLAAALPVLIGWMSSSMSLGTAIGIDASLSYSLVVLAALLLPLSRATTFDRLAPVRTPAGGVRDAIT